MISATDPDWEREKTVRGRFEPGKKMLAAIRRYHRLTANSGFMSRMISPIVVFQFRFWSVISGADIPLNSKIGGGLLIPHPNGIVIHPDAQIGPNCLIFQQVTIGIGSKPGLPIIEGHVDIGAGAKILGGIHIGAHAKIGANAVVVNDIPSNATAVGIPAVVR